MKNNIKFTILAVILITIIAIAVTPVSFQNDTFYSIKIGEYITQNGITMQDPFSWHEDLPYEFPHWAFDVGIYLIYNVTGFAGIYASTIILCTLLGITIYLVNSKITKNELVSLVLTIGMLFLLSPYITARAHLFTYILFMLTLFFIQKFLQTRKKVYAVLLLLIPVIIANTHVAVFPFYFLLYLPYIAENIVYKDSNLEVYIRKKKIDRINKMLAKKKITEDYANKEKTQLENYISNKAKLKEEPYKIVIENNKNIKYLVIIMIIALLVGFLTPIGATPYTYLYDTMQGNTTDSISEHAPLVLVNNMPFLCILIGFVMILILTDTKIKLSNLFLLAGMLILALYSQRQTALFIILCSTVLNVLVCDFLNKYDSNICSSIKSVLTKWDVSIYIITIAVLVAAIQIKPKLDDKFVDESTYPVSAATYILENLDTQNIKLFNEYNYGSYLLYREIPVFIDSRADLYAPEFNHKKDIFSDFINISDIGVYYEDKFEEYGITHVILYKNSKLNLLLKHDSNYTNLYEDNDFIIYKR
ncbi:MAG: hypothetical protein LBL91_02820 [Lachnospiraceae bacterium]|nr:hypothetical protein [Lachnospiraceae bacterium]